MSSPLLRIRAGIEAGNANEVVAGVKQADSTNVTLAANVRDMIQQWLKANAPSKLSEIGMAPEPVPASEPAAAVPAMDAGGGGASPTKDDEGIKAGDGKKGWSTTGADAGRAAIGIAANPAKAQSLISPEKLRLALLRFMEGAPKGSDAALGLGIMEESDGRYLPFSMLGRAVGLEEDENLSRTVQRAICQARSGIFSIAPDGSGCGLIECLLVLRNFLFKIFDLCVKSSTHGRELLNLRCQITDA